MGWNCKYPGSARYKLAKLCWRMALSLTIHGGSWRHRLPAKTCELLQGIQGVSTTQEENHPKYPLWRGSIWDVICDHPCFCLQPFGVSNLPSGSSALRFCEDGIMIPLQNSSALCSGDCWTNQSLYSGWFIIIVLTIVTSINIPVACCPNLCGHKFSWLQFS
jgi:hypothetical protein